MATNITPGFRPPIPTSAGGSGTASTRSADTAAAPSPAKQAPVASVPTDTYTTGGSAQPQPAGPPPTSLTARLDTVLDLKGLMKQLSSDLLTQSAALFGQGALTRDVKATRLMEFLVPYAQRFVELKQGAPMDPRVAAQAMATLLKPMMTAGLGHVIETTKGRSGQEVATDLLSKDSSDEVSAAMAGLRFDSTDPLGLVAQPIQTQVTPQLRQARVAEAEVNQPAEERGLEHKARLQTATWGGWARFRNDVGRTLDQLGWNVKDRNLVGWALGTLALAMLVVALLSLLH